MKFIKKLVNVIIVALFFSTELVLQIQCLNFSYPKFNTTDRAAFEFTDGSDIYLGAIQVTRDVRADILSNISGRALFGTKFKLTNTKKNKTSSFNSTFVLNITPQTSPGGEGVAFILAQDSALPDNSYGQWLGLLNSTTNGSSLTKMVAVEFDTKKSYLEDLDGDHVGVDLNSINSVQQVSLLSHGVNLSSGTDVTAMVLYNGVSEILDIFVFMSANYTDEKTKNPILSMNLSLSDHLSEEVFIGFSASTGVNTQLNCVRSWYFNSTNVEDKSKNLLWVKIVVPLISVLFVFAIVGFCVYHKIIRAKKVQNEHENQKEKYPGIERELEISTTLSPQKYQLKQLIIATDNFNEKNKLGEGGFGAVYKGLLYNKEVAVKRISKDSRQGKQEFLSEVKTIGNLHHRNLVKLIGWCYEKNELLLVYEFMPNGSLEKLIFLDPNSKSSTPLSWGKRVGIIYGVAQALDYLHNGCEKCVLHRDIKLSNIMLDSDYNPKLGDFGLARTIISEKTHHSTKEIAGTPGYIAPEFFHTGRASTEIDVYAFGILILETVCGKKPINYQKEQNVYTNGVVELVWELYRREKVTEAIDDSLNGEYDKEEAECVLLLGLNCCHPNPYERPSMRNVLQVLTGEADPPQLPFEKPAFMWPASAVSMAASSFSMDGLSITGTKLSPFSEISGR